MSIAKRVGHGVISGMVAGVFFALFLFMSGMTETLGSIINMPTKLGGLIVHSTVSIGSGIFFALILGCLINSWLAAIVWGLLFGIGMWIGGPMTLLPYLSSGVPLFAKWNIVGVQSNMPPLVGHLVYGFVLGLVYYALKKRV